MQPGLKNSYAQDLPELSKECIPSGFKNPEIILNMSFDCFKNLIDFLDYKIYCDNQQMMNCFTKFTN